MVAAVGQLVTTVVIRTVQVWAVYQLVRVGLGRWN